MDGSYRGLEATVKYSAIQSKTPASRSGHHDFERLGEQLDLHRRAARRVDVAVDLEAGRWAAGGEAHREAPVGEQLYLGRSDVTSPLGLVEEREAAEGARVPDHARVQQPVVHGGAGRDRKAAAEV